jgi:hypothetical protein
VWIVEALVLVTSTRVYFLVSWLIPHVHLTFRSPAYKYLIIPLLLYSSIR